MNRAWNYRRAAGAALVAAVAIAAVVVEPVAGDDSETLLTIDHHVRIRSTVPAIAGQPAHLDVRERVKAGTALRGSALGDRVVLFVHGAGTPAEVAFDIPHQDAGFARSVRAGCAVSVRKGTTDEDDARLKAEATGVRCDFRLFAGSVERV